MNSEHIGDEAGRGQDLTASTPRLLPCPFCGGEAAIDDVGTFRTLYTVGCNNDACLVDNVDAYSTTSCGEAVTAWNARNDQTYSDEHIRTMAQRWLAENASSKWTATPLDTLHRFIRGDGKAPDGVLEGLGFARVIVKVKP